MIRKTLLSLTLVGVIMLPDIGSAQYAGNYDLTGVYNVYLYIIRELSNSLDDSLYGGYAVKAYWPSQQSALFSTDLLTYQIGDTVEVIVPLPIPIALQAVGVALNSDIYDDGNIVITGTYPSIQTSDCSTAVTIPAITDNATYSTSGDPVFTGNTSEQGWGITTSGVFATNMYPPDLNTEVEGEHYGVGTEHVNWGKFIANYSDNTFAFVQTAEIYWEQTDHVETGAGVDSQGELNGALGVVAAFGDSSTVPGLAALYPALGLNVGTFPIIGGTGLDLDADGEPDGVVPPPNPVAGLPGLEWGYIFDPSGPDGTPFSGDEPFQFTGYYLTRHFLIGAGTIQTVLGPDANGDGIPDNLYAIIAGGVSLTDAVNQIAGVFWNALWPQLATSAEFDLNSDGVVNAADSTIAAGYATAIGTYASTFLTAQLVQVGLGNITQAEALTNTGSATAVYALGILTSLGITVDDSDHDFNGVNGRLVFQVGNNCIPRNQHLTVRSFWVNTGTAEIDSDESLIPKKFALYDNYPNPFNPTTQIAVDLPEAAATEITVWNIMGQRVATLYSGDLKAGHHTVNFDGHDSNGKQLTSGMYLYRVAAGKYNATKKMTLMK